jgi:hypothetical protein
VIKDVANKLGHGIKTTVQDRSKEMKRNVKRALNPATAVKKTFGIAKNAVLKEAPELAMLGALTSPITSFFGDVVRNSKAKRNTAKMNAGAATPSQFSNPNTTPNATGNASSLMRPLNESVVLLERIIKQNDRLYSEVRSLTDLTREGFGLTKKSLIEMRKANRINSENARSARFQRQRETPMPVDSGELGLKSEEKKKEKKSLAEKFHSVKETLDKLSGIAKIAGTVLGIKALSKFVKTAPTVIKNPETGKFTSLKTEEGKAILAEQKRMKKLQKRSGLVYDGKNWKDPKTNKFAKAPVEKKSLFSKAKEQLAEHKRSKLAKQSGLVFDKKMNQWRDPNNNNRLAKRPTLAPNKTVENLKAFGSKAGKGIKTGAGAVGSGVMSIGSGLASAAASILKIFGKGALIGALVTGVVGAISGAIFSLSPEKWAEYGKEVVKGFKEYGLFGGLKAIFLNENFLTVASETITEGFKGLLNGFRNAIEFSLKLVFGEKGMKEMDDWLGENIFGPINRFFDWIKNFVNFVKNTFSGAVDDLKKIDSWLGEVGADIKGVFTDSKPEARAKNITEQRAAVAENKNAQATQSNVYAPTDARVNAPQTTFNNYSNVELDSTHMFLDRIGLL